jgi:hypothetical protein
LSVLQDDGEGVLVQQVGGDYLDPIEKMLDTFIAVMTGTTHDADYLVTLGKEKLGEVGAILTSDARDERSRHGRPGGEVVSYGRAR